MRADSGDLTYRPRSRYVSMIASCVVIAGLTAARGFEDGPTAVLRALPLALGFLGLLAWLLFWHPRVDVTDEGVTLVNPLRTIRVPWAALINVETQYALTLVTPDGRHRAWARTGTGPPRGGHRRQRRAGGHVPHRPRLARRGRDRRPAQRPVRPGGPPWSAAAGSTWSRASSSPSASRTTPRWTPSWNVPAIARAGATLVGVVVVALT